MADDDEAPGMEEAGASRRGAGSCVASAGVAECDSGSEDGRPVEEFALDKQESADTTSRQHRLQLKDIQGIPWERLQVSRASYRQRRLQEYTNYTNCIKEEEWSAVAQEQRAGWLQPTPLAADAAPYAFHRNWRSVSSSIVHFQLRNLLWAASAHDVFVVYDNRVQHWNSCTRQVSDVLDLRGSPKGPRIPGLSRVQVSTLCVSEGLVAAGGFTGELVLARLSRTDDEAEGEEEDAEEEQQEEEGWEEQELELEQWDGDDAADWLGAAAPDKDRGQQGGWAGASSSPLQQQAAQHKLPTWQLQQQQQPGSSCQLPGRMSQDQQRPSWCSSMAHHQAWQGASASPQPQQQQQQQQHWLTPHQRPRQHQKLRQQRGPQQQQQQQQGSAPEPVLGAAGPAAAEVLHSCRVTQSENGITNGIEIFNSCNYGHTVMTSNNDNCVRLFDVASGRPRQRLAFPFAVNYATLRPAGAVLGGGAVAAVVGDDPVTSLVDCRSGLQVMRLVGHRDYSFAAAWHPAGQLLATGNQDGTTRVWDVRSQGSPLAVLAGTMGAIRSLRFSDDGAFLAAAEPADFVHVYDVAGGFRASQEIDLFGEVAGVAFSPGGGSSLFVAISDNLYSSLVHFTRAW